MRFRQKFFVSGGVSQLGRMLFAHSLRAKAATLDVNCWGVQTALDLRAFQLSVHATILFEESSCVRAVRNKKLFHAPPAQCSWVSGARIVSRTRFA